MDEFAAKNVCLAAAQCRCALACYVLGWVRSRRGRRGGRALGTAAERGTPAPRKRVGGDGNLGALGGMARLALFCPARPGPWHSLLLCSRSTFSLLLCFCFLVSQTLFWSGRESGARERNLHRWGKQRLVLKISCLPLSNSQRSSKALAVSVQELAWDAGSRRKLSDPKVLSCKSCPWKCVYECMGRAKRQKHPVSSARESSSSSHSPAWSCVPVPEAGTGIEVCMMGTEFGVNHHNITADSQCL